MDNTESRCKPGGCSSIGCEGGIYCFNVDGTPKVVSEETRIKFEEFHKSFSEVKNENNGN